MIGSVRMHIKSEKKKKNKIKFEYQVNMEDG